MTGDTPDETASPEVLVRILRSPAIVFYEHSVDGGSLFRRAANVIERLSAIIAERDAEIARLRTIIGDTVWCRACGSVVPLDDPECDCVMVDGADVQQLGGYDRETIEAARAKVVECAELRAEIARLRAGGCARDQTTTQYCAEAVGMAREIAELRRIVSECAAAIGNGTFCAPDASLDFMAHIPAEIALVLQHRDNEIAELRRFIPVISGELERLRALTTWRPIDDEARNGAEWAIQTAIGRVFKAQWLPFIVVNDRGEDVGAWVACDEDVRPPCWTDCICWASNEDDVASDPPVMYAPLPPAPTVETDNG